jgi:N-acetylmuramoyl-L-alanine amidase
MVKSRVHNRISRVKWFNLTIERLRRIRSAAGLIFLLAALLSIGPPSRASESKANNPTAIQIFDQAVGLRTALEGKTASSRTLGDYKKVINKYRSVYYQYPGSSKADDALIAVAELYQLMANDLKNPSYFEQAIKAYKFLLKEYPGSPYRTEALYTTGEIYLNDLRDPTNAQEIFKEFISKYPHSSKAQNAKARLDDLRAEMKQAKKTTVKPASNGTKPVENADIAARPSGTTSSEKNLATKEASTKEIVAEESTQEPELAEVLPPPRAYKENQSAGQKTSPHGAVVTDDSSTKAVSGSGTKNSLLEGSPVGQKSGRKSSFITDLRYWNTEEYTRIIVVPDGEVKFLEGKLEDPARYYLDIENTKLSSSFTAKAFPINDGYVNQIRLGQLKEQVTRIVVDLGEIKNCHVYNLQNPYRIIIDLSGSPRHSLLAVKKDWQVTRGDPLPDELERPAISKKKPSPEQKKKDNDLETAQKTDVSTDKALGTSSSDHPVRPSAKNDHAQSKEKSTAFTVAPLVAKQEAQPKPKTATPKSDGTRSLTRTLGLKIGRIVIDPGHGGHDTGTVGPSGLQEKDLVLDISMRLKSLIEERLEGEVILTRTEDVFVALEERTAIANHTQADLFISIHANSSRNRRVSGVETFFLNFTTSPGVEEIAARENASAKKTVFELQDLVQKITLNEKVDESKEFAQIVQKTVSSSLYKPKTPHRDRGVKQAPFIVLIGANMPSILSEISFVSNPMDEKLLKSTSYRQKIAEALCEGIASYAGNLGGIKTATVIH